MRPFLCGCNDSGIDAYGFSGPTALAQIPRSVVNAGWPFFRQALHHLSAKTAHPFLSFKCNLFVAVASDAAFMACFAPLSLWPPADAGAALFCPVSDIGSAFAYTLPAAAAFRMTSRPSSIARSIDVNFRAYFSGQPWMTLSSFCNAPALACRSDPSRAHS